jgi:hypothetical protein
MCSANWYTGSANWLHRWREPVHVFHQAVHMFSKLVRVFRPPVHVFTRLVRVFGRAEPGRLVARARDPVTRAGDSHARTRSDSRLQSEAELLSYRGE